MRQGVCVGGGGGGEGGCNVSNSGSQILAQDSGRTFFVFLFFVVVFKIFCPVWYLMYPYPDTRIVLRIYCSYNIGHVGNDPKGCSELPSSTFLPSLVRFFKENTAVCFFLQKYFFPLFFFNTGEWKYWNLHTLLMLWKLGQSFLIIMLKNKAKIAPEST